LSKSVEVAKCIMTGLFVLSIIVPCAIIVIMGEIGGKVMSRVGESV